MKNIALISVTLNAVNPMTEYLSRIPDVHVMNYLDSYILEEVNREGHMTDSCMGRMVAMLTHACEDGADGIIITCTIFSGYVDYFQGMFSVPVVGADTAMMELAGRQAGRTALICTFDGTKDASAARLESFCRKSGKTYEIVPYVLSDAFDAAQRYHMEIHDEIIRKKAAELDQDFDQIVLAQISMANAVKGMEMQHAKLYTSPSAAYETILAEMEKRKGIL